jgi:hypothetical protein
MLPEKFLNIKSLVLQTPPHPTHTDVENFKRRVAAVLKSGYFADGALIADEDGSLKQKLTTKGNNYGR